MRNVGNPSGECGTDTADDVDRKLSPSTAAPPCPKCAAPLSPLWLEGEWQFYRCDCHGIVVLTPTAELSSDEPDDSKVRR